MENALRQIAAIAYYELRMQWRQRAILVMTLAMLVITFFVIFSIRYEAGDRWDLDKIAGTTSTEAVIGLTFVPAAATFIMLMPIVFANLIPRDRQIKIRDMLDCTSISSAAYLTGKMVAGWVVVGSSMLVVALLAGLAWRIFIAPFDLKPYLEAWFFGALPIIIINIGMIVLLASPFPDNRFAVLAGLIFAFVIPSMLGFAPRGNWLDLLNPIRSGLFYHYAQQANFLTDVTLYSVPVTITTGLAQLALTWLLAWGISKRFQS